MQKRCADSTTARLGCELHVRREDVPCWWTDAVTLLVEAPNAPIRPRANCYRNPLEILQAKHGLLCNSRGEYNTPRVTPSGAPRGRCNSGGEIHPLSYTGIRVGRALVESVDKCCLWINALLGRSQHKGVRSLN